MAARRKTTSREYAKMNYMGPTERPEGKGTKPTIEPTSVSEIMTLTVLFVCKKFVFYNTNRKVCMYLGTLFLVSLIGDVGTIPKTYLSRSDNVFNQYFVKYAWAWNLMLLVPYATLTSYIYCCGLRDKMAKHHVSRIGIATFFWWFWTNVFNVIETNLGKCNVKGFNSKQECLKGGNFWNGFDISGHSFILVYGCLVLIEETRSITNWDSIKDYMRLEEHYRVTRDKTASTNPLKDLTNEQFSFLRTHYEKYTPYIRGLFIAITALTVLWDVMLIGTMLYYHVMIEKLLGGVAAVLTWFVTYRVWYPSNYLPKLPGNGVFRYMKTVQPPRPVKKRTSSIVNGTHFMGRPLVTPKMTDGNTSDIDDGATR